MNFVVGVYLAFNRMLQWSRSHSGAECAAKSGGGARRGNASMEPLPFRSGMPPAS